MIPAYVFGHGKCWLQKEKSIRELFDVIGFIDNNKTGTDENGVPFVHPEELSLRDKTPVIIASGRNHFISMAYQLRDLGVDEKQILFGGNLMPSFDVGELIVKSARGKYDMKQGLVCVSVGGADYFLKTAEKYWILLDELRKRDSVGSVLKQMCVEPISRSYGLEFGKAVDRVYIEKFLEENAGYIHGDVIEIGDSAYTLRFGSDLNRCIATHVDGTDGCKKVNIETGEGVEENISDCFICTQTLQYVFNLASAIENIWKILKSNGTALITVPFLAQYSVGDRSWSDYWRFTPWCLQKCLTAQFGEANVLTGSFGNVKTVFGFLYGLNAEDLTDEDYDFMDPIYPLIVWAVCHKE